MFRFRVVMVVALIIAISTIGYAAAPKAAFDGSFITGDLCGSWSNARWQEELSAMKAAGMKYLVLQAAAISYPGEVTQTYFPSDLPNTKQVSSTDVVAALLSNAESAGIKVFIGIDMSNEWWNVYGNDTTWLYGQMNFDNQLCDELWNQYKAKYPNAFYGWYWAYEVDNVNWTSPTQQAVLIKAMNMQIDHLDSTGERLPLLWCPFYNSVSGTPSAYEAMWKNVLAGLHTQSGDVFCPQDGVGVGHSALDQLANWYSALRQAVDTKPGLTMWSDVETFEGYSGSFISAPVDRLVSQLKIEQPYVDDYITWEWTYYDSPYHINSGFYETYLDYLQTNSVETIPPSSPTNVTAEFLPDGNVDLSWKPSTDDIGICGYNVFRDGTLIGKLQVPFISGDTGTSVAPTEFIDKGLNPNTSYNYNVQAYDFAGNLSDTSSSITVETSNYKVVSLGKSYTCSVSPSSSYPDHGVTKLTNGIFATNASYADPAWVGFLTSDTINVTIDLGQPMAVQQFLGEYLLDPQPAVYLPKEVTVSVSTDGATFSRVGILADSTPGDSLSPSIHDYLYKLSTSVMAQYVRFTTIPGPAWTFVDEYEVLNNSATAIRQMLPSVPSEFALSNSYPDPFNPSTTVEVTLAKSGTMSLKIYNILGQRVDIVNQGYEAAGKYTYHISMDSFASGVYFLVLREGTEVAIRKLVLLK